MDDQARGKEIYKAVLKAGMTAIIGLGVSTQDNIDKFMFLFTDALNREWLKIGVFQPQEAQMNVPRAEGISEPTIASPITALNLKPLITHNLKKVGIETIEQLMTTMQQTVLTEIKGIKEKSAKQILEALAEWQKGSI